MKLPLNTFLAPILKKSLGRTRLFCNRPTFSMSIYYTLLYGVFGFFLSAYHLKKHLGEIPTTIENSSIPGNNDVNFMLVHDLRVISSSMGLVQYACLVAGILTENPSLFLPHLFGQLLIVIVKILNTLLLLVSINFKAYSKLIYKVPAIILLTFNCHYNEDLFLLHPLKSVKMETESNNLLNQLYLKHVNQTKAVAHVIDEVKSQGIKLKLRALLVALLGVSMSACAFASQPVELELNDDDVAQKLNNVSFARRITKPTIRLVMGSGKLSAVVTAISSLLLLVAVMSKQSWWQRGARWLAAPALLVAALEAASDASDAMLAALLRGSAEPSRVIAQTVAAVLLVTIEILVWYFIAKFFEFNPPEHKENLRALPQNNA